MEEIDTDYKRPTWKIKPYFSRYGNRDVGPLKRPALRLTFHLLHHTWSGLRTELAKNTDILRAAASLF